MSALKATTHKQFSAAAVPHLCRPVRVVRSLVAQHASLHHTLLHGVSSSRSSVVVAAAAAAAAGAGPSCEDDNLRNCAVAFAKVADDTKATDISVLHVEPLVSWTSYMVLCTVMSRPQLLAVLSRIEDAATEYGLEKQNTAGSSQWEVLDFGSVVVHVFTAEQRELYNLDDFYALAEEVELPFLNGQVATAAGGGSSSRERRLAATGADAAGSSREAAVWSKSL